MIVSAHFQRSEFACPHCGAEFVRPALIDHLERLRSLIGKPIVIVSGYRCPIHNAAVGGATDSQHVYAAAADIPLRIATPVQAVRAGFTGVGVQDGWARHVDVRDGALARWTYASTGAH